MQRPHMQAMADLFALSKIQDEILFRNDEYVSPEKAKAIKRIRCGALRCLSCALASAGSMAACTLQNICIRSICTAGYACISLLCSL